MKNPKNQLLVVAIILILTTSCNNSPKPVDSEQEVIETTFDLEKETY